MAVEIKLESNHGFLHRNAHGLLLLAFAAVLIIHLFLLPVTLVLGWLSGNYAPFQLALMSMIFIGPMEVILIGLAMLPFHAGSARSFDMRQLFELLTCSAVAAFISAPHIEGMMNEASFGPARYSVVLHTFFLLTMSVYGVQWQIRTWLKQFN